MTPPTSAPSRRAALRAGVGTGAVFFLSGAFFGTWASRVPALRDQTDASESQLGQVLLVMGIGSLLSMPFTGRACTRYGARRVVLVMAIVSGAGLIAAGSAGSVAMLSASLFLYGFAYGSWDVAMNVHGHAAETMAGRPWMPRYHAMWSIGGMAGSAVGALFALAGVSPGVQFSVVVPVSLVLLAIALTTFVDDRLVHADRAAAGSLRPATDHVHRHRRGVLSWRLAAIGTVTLCGVVAEGAAGDWLALLLIDDRGIDPGAAATGYTVFAFAMAATRLAGSSLLAWRGRVTAIRLAGVATGLGVTATILAPALSFAYLGAALWGLGVALIFPATMSAAGDTPGRSADAIAFVAATGYGALLIGPPLIGFLGQEIGLGVALWVVPFMAAVVVLLAPSTAPPAAVRLTADAPPSTAPGRRDGGTARR